MAPTNSNNPSHQQPQGRASETSGRPSQPRRNDESWVELSSQPSSSSLSSIGDEIVTTGLRVGSSSYPPRRRRLQQMHQNHMPSTYIVSHAAAQAGTSSQEEYDETESSEEDHTLGSSTEQVSPAINIPRQQTAIRPGIPADSEEEDDDDENATALGRPSTSPTFRPQPNAFSHPPSHLTHRHSTSSAVPQYPPYGRPPMSQRSHTRPNRGAPGPGFSQADNDAALRASLTTLLSCAAAARGLPKKDTSSLAGGPSGTGAGIQRSTSQPMELRIIPESELLEPDDPGPSTIPSPSTNPSKAAIPAHLHSQTPGPRTASNSSCPSAPSSTSSHSPPPPSEKSKRPTTSAVPPKCPRATKKKRTASPDPAPSTTTTIISPSVLTWVVSAGVLVLVSVVGFGAGYVIGREVGRQEAGALGGMGFGAGGGEVGNASASCGGEMLRSSTASGSGGTLRRFRWGAGGRSVVA